ncbi:hypothetical protein I9W82_003540 [Candida metapsilosis]|uniref:Uncharacterized protein n=1 Tax=Candida metapsilosis TaxID=273372 RepID=A0A8H8DB33_9ASCO|nr:hypothetical protein I9W82_003540 [Candida metapsilosis]
MFKRSIIQVLKRDFHKGSTQQFIKTSSTRSTSKQATQAVGLKNSIPKANTQQGSFKSFAEYRLRMTNQSPLAVRSKDFNSNLRPFHH